MKAVLLQMQFRACANRQSQTIEQIHTATKLTVTCPNVGDGNQPRILASAMLALGFGQINHGPAALSGRIFTNGHPEELWAEFKPVVYPCPPHPSPDGVRTLGKLSRQQSEATPLYRSDSKREDPWLTNGIAILPGPFSTSSHED